MGDVKASLNKMLNNIAQEKEIHTDWILRIKHLVNEWKAEVSPLLNSDAIPMRPERLSNELTKCLPDDAILVSDTGQIGRAHV